MPHVPFRHLTTAAAIALFGATAAAEPIYAVTDPVTGAPLLVSFDSATPGTVTTVGAISGLVGGQTLRGIDFRASNGLLYAISNLGTSSAAQLYTVNLSTGALTTVGSGFALTGNTSDRISIDFNPVANVLRVVTGNAQSYRVNANTGALIAQDTSVNPANVYGDVAYSNNVAGATSTTLYTYDYSNDRIGTIGSVGGTPSSPNGGQYFNIGSTGVVSVNAAIGFDISGATGTAYASLDAFSSPNTNSEFYTVNLATGALGLIGTFSAPILDFSVQTFAANAVPEPATLAMVTLALLPAFGAAARRRRA